MYTPFVLDFDCIECALRNEAYTSKWTVSVRPTHPTALLTETTGPGLPVPCSPAAGVRSVSLWILTSARAGQNRSQVVPGLDVKAPAGTLLGNVSHGMVFGMATSKVTITLQDAQIEEIRSLIAAGKATSVSAFVQHAVGIALYDAAGWREMLEDALQQTGGPLSKKERAWADALLSPRRQNRSSRKGKAA